jgi:hypothetical protein
VVRHCVYYRNLMNYVAMTREGTQRHGRGGGEGRRGKLYYFSCLFPCCIRLQLRIQSDLTLWKNDRHRSEIVVYIRYSSTYLKLSYLFSAAIFLTLQFSTNPILHYKHTLNLSCLVIPCPFGALDLRHKAVVNADEQCCLTNIAIHFNYCIF